MNMDYLVFGIVSILVCVGFFLAGFSFAVHLVNKSVGLK